jgi:thiamine-phosphate pyrophosphorylase
LANHRAESELEALSRTAAAFAPRTARGLSLPNLLFFTDPARVADPEAVARRLPVGAGVVFRAFGAADAIDQGRRLRAIASERGLVLLVGADPDLAEAIAADGVHLPQRLMALLPVLHERWPARLVTLAAHDLTAVEAGARAGVDALVISPIFASNSPSAGRPLGVERLRTLVAATSLPVYALGGVRADTVSQLANTGIVGIAAVEALAEAAP